MGRVASFEGAIVGFDADGILQAVALIDPKRGMTEQTCKRDCRQGGLTIKRVSIDECQKLMKEHKWGCK